MKMGPNEHFDDDDRELDDEFSEISAIYKAARPEAPRVPAALDRRIRQQARYHIGEEMQRHWIFGFGPQLSLAASLLFGVGVFYVVSLEHDKDSRKYEERAPMETVVPDQSAVIWQAEERATTARATSPAHRFAKSNLTQLKKAVVTTEPLEQLVGNWRGENLLWLTPETPVRKSETSAAVSTVAKGKFLSISYVWEEGGKPQEGMMLISVDKSGEKVEGAWIDSWHMGDEIMKCDGTVSNGVISMLGHYKAPPDPDWGWRIEVLPRAQDRFQVRMYNITPQGEETLAVEATFSRS